MLPDQPAGRGRQDDQQAHPRKAKALRDAGCRRQGGTADDDAEGNQHKAGAPRSAASPKAWGGGRPGRVPGMRIDSLAHNGWLLQMDRLPGILSLSARIGKLRSALVQFDAITAIAYNPCELSHCPSSIELHPEAQFEKALSTPLANGSGRCCVGGGGRGCDPRQPSRGPKQPGGDLPAVLHGHVSARRRFSARPRSRPCKFAGCSISSWSRPASSSCWWRASLFFAVLRFRNRPPEVGHAVPRQHQAGARLDGGAGRDPGGAAGLHPADHGPGEGGADRQRAARQGHRPPMVVGVPLPRPEHLTPKSWWCRSTPIIEVAIESNDVEHGFWVPELFGKVDAVPGYTNRVQLHAHHRQRLLLRRAVHPVLRAGARPNALWGGGAHGRRTLPAWAANQQQPAAPPEKLTGDAGRRPEAVCQPAVHGLPHHQRHRRRRRDGAQPDPRGQSRIHCRRYFGQHARRAAGLD